MQRPPDTALSLLKEDGSEEVVEDPERMQQLLKEWDPDLRNWRASDKSANPNLPEAGEEGGHPGILLLGAPDESGERPVLSGLDAAEKNEVMLGISLSIGCPVENFMEETGVRKDEEGKTLNPCPNGRCWGCGEGEGASCGDRVDELRKNIKENKGETKKPDS